MVLQLVAMIAFGRRAIQFCNEAGRHLLESDAVRRWLNLQVFDRPPLADGEGDSSGEESPSSPRTRPAKMEIFLFSHPFTIRGRGRDGAETRLADTVGALVCLAPASTRCRRARHAAWGGVAGWRSLCSLSGMSTWTVTSPLSCLDLSAHSFVLKTTSHLADVRLRCSPGFVEGILCVTSSFSYVSASTLGRALVRRLRATSVPVETLLLMRRCITALTLRLAHILQRVLARTENAYTYIIHRIVLHFTYFPHIQVVFHRLPIIYT